MKAEMSIKEQIADLKAFVDSHPRLLEAMQQVIDREASNESINNDAEVTEML